MQQVKNHKTITISRHITENKFNALIDLPINPDFVVLRFLTFVNADTANSPPMFIIKSSLIDNKILTSCPGNTENQSLYSEIFHKLSQRPVQGEYSFEILDTDGAIPDNVGATFEIHICLTLEFVEYAK